MIEVYVTSAFSKNNKGGNKAGVVLQDYKLSDNEKIKLARELGYSETVYFSHSEDADYKLEYFTPAGEVPICGHATIAAFTTLEFKGLLGKSAYKIETKAGVLNIMAEEDGMIFMEQNKPEFYEILNHSVGEQCLHTENISNSYPVQIVSTGLKDILIPIDKPHHLLEAVPDMELISEISRNYDVIGIHAFSLINEQGLTAICRNFAPLYGIEEESATGTSSCALACYLFRYGQRQKRYVFQQGHNLRSVSELIVKLDLDEETVKSVAVGGHGYLMEKKVFSYPQ